MAEANDDDTGRARLWEVARLFAKLGIIGFGGPAAHIALMRAEVVRRRQWLDDAAFMDYVGAANLIPGPNSTELAMHLGQRRGGPRGLLIAGACFIVPAVLMVATLAWLYEQHGTDPRVVDLRYGLLPVIIAIVAHAVVGLARTTVRDAVSALVAAIALAAYFAGVHELAILVVAGGSVAIWRQRRRLAQRGHGAAMFLLLLLLPGRPVLDAAVARPRSTSLVRLFLIFLEIGSVLYGSGYVLLAFLQRNLVEQNGWITDQQLLDATAVGQITPGPVFTTATFIGWQIDGPAGAAVATVGIFLPSFVFVALLGRIVPWMRARPTAQAFLSGVTTASLALMVGVTVELGDHALVDAGTVVIALAALGALVVAKLSPTWLVAAGIAIGIAHALI